MLGGRIFCFTSFNEIHENFHPSDGCGTLKYNHKIYIRLKTVIQEDKHLNLNWMILCHAEHRLTQNRNLLLELLRFERFKWVMNVFFLGKYFVLRVFTSWSVHIDWMAKYSIKRCFIYCMVALEDLWLLL